MTSNAGGRNLRKRGDLAGTLDRVQQMLDQVLAAEREQLAGEDGDDARLAEMTLDDLPSQVGSAVRELADYDWHSDEARAGYEQIQQMLQREVLDAQFAGMKQALVRRRPRDHAAGPRHARRPQPAAGRPRARRRTPTNSSTEFMDKHGEFFPDNPGDRRGADRLARAATGRGRADDAVAEPRAAGGAGGADGPGARRRRPRRASSPSCRTTSRHCVPACWAVASRPTSAATSRWDTATRSARSPTWPTSRRSSGSSARTTRAPASTTSTWRRSSGSSRRPTSRTSRRCDSSKPSSSARATCSRDGDGLSLTPKALRRLGESALRRIFAQLDADARGDHDDQRSGAADERTGAFLPWRFGDERPIDAVRTVQNAVLRRASQPDGRRTGPGWTSRTSRSPRPSGVRRPRWPSASTCRSR